MRNFINYTNHQRREFGRVSIEKHLETEMRLLAGDGESRQRKYERVKKLYHFAGEILCGN